VAKPSATDEEYVRRVERMTWKQLAKLWQQIQARSTPGWGSGKALEHLVIRAFRLSGLEAEYPYDVPPGGKPIEQIDGLVHLDCYTFLVECKDKGTIDIEPVAKLLNQLSRRPATTLGCVFSADDFTEPALLLTDLSLPHRILLWSETDIGDALGRSDFKGTLLAKYRHLCKYGLTDHSPHYKQREV
jgi:hypothetical protein